MTPGEWRAIEDLFHRAAAQPAGSREAWLREACRGDERLQQAVLDMLKADRTSDGEFLESVGSAATHWLEDVEPPPERAGPWRILDLIGRGGMGAVYLASRDDAEYEKRVAVKLLTRGIQSAGTRERFLVERQILSELDHPNIARMLDGGTAGDGRPYLVMEFVDGRPLLEHCRDLPLRERVRLLAAVSDAVAYAHQRLIVHRDLKPANILVDSQGSPKLLDFGIAKLIDSDLPRKDETQAVFTADYASPEQLEGKPVTTATDVYGLGGILFQLIAGRPAHVVESGGLAELVAAICDRDIERPSRFAAERIPQDLDNIVLRAMARDPSRRYPTAHEFAEDLRRFLDNRPIAARADSWTYVAAKFVRRHLAPVTVIAFLVVALAASAAWSMWAANEANRQRARADERSLRLRKLTQQLLFDVQASLDGVVGATKARQMLVKTALEHFEQMSREGGGDASLRRDLAVAYRRIGDVQGYPRNPNLGDLGGAIASYRRALSLIEGLPSDFALRFQRAVTLQNLGDTEVAFGKDTDPERSYLAALETLRDAEPVAADETRRIIRVIDVHQSMGRMYSLRSDLPSARKHEAQARELLRNAAAAAPGDRVVRRRLAIQQTQDAFAFWRDKMNDRALAEANAAVREAESILKGGANQEQHVLMQAYQMRADILSDQSLKNRDYNAALRDAKAAVVLAKQLVAAEPANLRSKYDLSQMHFRVSRISTLLNSHREALAAARDAVAETEAILKGRPDGTQYYVQHGNNQYRLGRALRNTGEMAEALAVFRSSVDTLRPWFDQRWLAASISLDSYEEIGDVERQLGRRAEAAQAYKAGLQLFAERRAALAAQNEGYDTRLQKKLAGAGVKP